ncbi:MAG: S-adenosylmethionine decarboxylase [Dietzia sp.]
MKDLAPTIHRQRLIVEGYPEKSIDDGDIKEYLKRLALVTEMVVLIDPVTHRSDRFGWAGWVHWETSGAHFYAWDEPVLFFSVDLYTCKQFSAKSVVEYTRNFFSATEIVSKNA